MGKVTALAARCAAILTINSRVIRCKRPQINPARPHYQHRFRGRGNGYTLTIDWDQSVKPEKGRSNYQCGKCGEYGHSRRSCKAAV